MTPSPASDAARPASLRRRVAGLLVVGLWLCAPWACGGSMGPQTVKMPPPEPAATVEAAAAMFDAAEADLRAELLDQRKALPGYPPPSPSPSPPPPSPPPFAAQPSSRQGHYATQDRCTRACGALASMRRSADRLCELDGADTERCENVQRRVTSARQLILSICPACTQ